MENNEDVIQDSSPEEVIEEESSIESAPIKADKTIPYERFRQVNDELAKLKKQPVKVVNKALEVDDFIDISASLEGLDQREKEYIAQQHKYTGKSLKEIRNDENFLLWQTAYQQKVEKEKALAPSNKQTETDRPKSLLDKLKGASFEDKEKILSERGLYRTVRPRADRQFIGGK